MCIRDRDVDIHERNAARTQQTKSVTLSIYPNPVSDRITILLDESGPARVSIYDLNGKKVSERELRPTQGRLQVPVSFLKPGIYFLQITGEDQIYTGKFDKI